MLTKMEKDKSVKEIEIPQGINVEIDGAKVKVKGKEGEVERNFEKSFGGISLKKEGDKIILKMARTGKKEKKLAGTVVARIKGMIQGVQKKFEYKLQVCNVHFPITATVDSSRKMLVIKNFLGEKKERTAPLKENVEVKVDKGMILVTSCDKEAAGQTSANIEVATKIKSRDRRIFQDGIFLIESPAGEV